jgi:hypothetical protein
MDNQKITDILQRLTPTNVPSKECESLLNGQNSVKCDFNLVDSMEADSEESIDYTGDENFIGYASLARADITCERVFDLKKEDRLVQSNALVEESNNLVGFMMNLKFNNDDEANNNINLRCSEHIRTPSRSYSQYFIKKPNPRTCKPLQFHMESESFSKDEESDDDGFSIPLLGFMKPTTYVTKDEEKQVKEQKENSIQDSTTTMVISKIQPTAETNDLFNIDSNSETIPKPICSDGVKPPELDTPIPKVKKPENINNKNKKRTKVNTLPGMGVIIQDTDYF